jgi:hypothetical protein
VVSVTDPYGRILGSLEDIPFQGYLQIQKKTEQDPILEQVVAWKHHALGSKCNQLYGAPTVI